MANNYKIKVRVEIETCVDTPTDGPLKKGVEAFERVISAEQAHSIDECEQILLQIHYEAVQDALACHLSAVSQQYALEVAGSLEQCQVKPYRVDGEVGRITFDCYWVEPTNRPDIAPSPFPALHAQEWYRTTGFKEIALAYGTPEESYRQAAALIHRVRHQPGATPSRTLRENTEAEGRQVMVYLEQRATIILQEHGFTAEGAPAEAAGDRVQQTLVALSPERVERAVRACAPEPEWAAEMALNPVPYEDPTCSTHVSLDDVGVKGQKARRKQSEAPSQEPKRVYNTIAHIAHAGRSYILTGQGVARVLRLVLAFLLHNQLLMSNLLFFVDGQRTLYTTILAAFAWLNALQIVLDWFHLEKRCKEELSRALKGREIRNGLLEELLPCLWHSCVDRAIARLRAVEPIHIKDEKALRDLIGYLERNRPYIPCYSVRRSRIFTPAPGIRLSCQSARSGRGLSGR